MLEALVVIAVGIPDASALAPQVSAPTPFDIFHDLRWLLVYHPSWWAFGLELAALVALRSALTVAIVRAAWPHGVARPVPAAHLRATAVGVSIVMLALFPIAVLAFAMAVFSLPWLFYATVPVVLLAALLVHQVPVRSTWWRDRPPREAVTGVLWSFVAVTVSGALIASAPTALSVPLAGLGGVANAWCWLRIVHALADRPASLRRRPFALVGLAMIVVLVVACTAGGFAVVVAIEAGREDPPLASATVDGPPVLVVKGFDSRWIGDTRRWVDGDYFIRRFSYRGVDRLDRPLAYERVDTHRSLRRLARTMRHQVEALHAETGEPVSIVAESEGALVASVYLDGTPDAPVHTAVLLSPLLDVGRVAYPRLGDDGWGVAAGTTLEGIAAALGAVTTVDVSVDDALFRSIEVNGPLLRGVARCRLPVERSFAVLPIDAGLAAPAPEELAVTHAVVPAVHGGLLGTGAGAELIGRVLDGRPASGSGLWSFAGDVVGALSAGWQAPDLVPGLAPEWRGLPEPSDCAGVRRALARWLG